MTIEEIIEELEESKDYPASDSASDEALDGAIDIMRKYQKIEEIVKDHDTCNMPEDYWYIDRIREVIEMRMTEYEKERQKIILKPCPFCGGEARLKKHQNLEQVWYVQCNQCGIRTTNSAQAAFESWKSAMNYPVNQWNRRVEDGIAD